jgi:PleD family two-component response regulator
MCEVNEADARQRFGTIRDSLAAVGIKVSLGIAALEPGDSVDTLIGRADAALLQARRESRGSAREP